MNTEPQFEFPFPPYPIQEQFMKSLYKTINEQKLGIFESPTGTGKSLSIICASIKWLLDEEKRKRTEIQANIETLEKQKQKLDENTDDWLSAAGEKLDLTKRQHSFQAEAHAMDRFDKKIREIKENRDMEVERKNDKLKWMKKTNGELNKEEDVRLNEDDAEKELLLEDFDVEDNVKKVDAFNDEEEDKYVETKLFYCSRTHSQLAQFIGEIIRSPYGKQVRVTTLGSRQNLCINDAIKRLNNISIINERCVELQNKKQKVTKRSENNEKIKRKKISNSTSCPYLTMDGIEQLSHDIMLDVQDIEGIVSAGKLLRACPFYSTRAAVNICNVVVVPYQLLFHKPTRDASGLHLKNSVVIIDEAHNLLETITHIHSSQITKSELLHTKQQLLQYRDKYSKRFSAFNLLHLNQLIFILNNLSKMLDGGTKTDGDEARIYKTVEFIQACDIENFNLFKLIEFCDRSKIAHKLHAFSTTTIDQIIVHNEPTGLKSFLTELAKPKPVKVEPSPIETKPIETKDKETSSNTILIVRNFLDALLNNYNDGRVMCVKSRLSAKSYMKYLVLNPAVYFKEVVRECRSVILAGGTMQPFGEFRDHLFKACGADDNRIATFSCDHVIPKENIAPIVVCNGPTGMTFDFSYDKRHKIEQLQEFGRLLLNVTNIIPSGVVCFFVSYDYEKTVYNHLDKTGVLAKIAAKKTVFREPKLTCDVDDVLRKYSDCIRDGKNAKSGQRNGAIIFSVVGGKLSEGLNFSDDLGRCVIVVGLPYPNIKSLELQEKMKYLNINFDSKAGNTHYENICMKAVNQCIGRAVRHQNDYSSILLIDSRFKRDNVKEALPQWIKRSLKVSDKFGMTMGLLSKFFNEKKKLTE